VVDDDFDDFQAAPLSAGPMSNNLAFTSAPAPIQPMSPPPQIQSNANLFNMLNTTTTSPPPMTANKAPLFMGAPMTPAAVPNYSPSVMSPSHSAARTGSIGGAFAATTPAAKPASSSGNFDDLWSMSLGSSNKPQTPTTQAKSMQDLQREKAQAGIWGAQNQQGRPPMGTGFGSFGASSAAPSTSNAAPAASSGNGLDDLLF
jgi:epsin